MQEAIVRAEKLPFRSVIHLFSLSTVTYNSISRFSFLLEIYDELLNSMFCKNVTHACVDHGQIHGQIHGHCHGHGASEFYNNPAISF
jgi:hypothetical protein